VGIATDHAATQAQLVGGEAEGLFGERLWHAGDFEEHIAREHDRTPEFWSAFAFTHPGFRWAGGDGLVWEDADKDLTFTFEVTSDSDPAGFDLIILDPAAVKRLESEFAEADLRAALGVTTAIPTLGLAEFSSFRDQSHESSPWLNELK
jgi:hypothetical protein